MPGLKLHVYGLPSAALDLEALVSYLERRLPRIASCLRPPFLDCYGQGQEEALAWAFARARVRHPEKRGAFAPLPGEVDYERRRLAQPGRRLVGILYDGLAVMALFRDLIPREQRSLHHIHIVLTDQLLGTWEEDDARYHARAAIYGVPSLISTTGLVEAPARPREYYLLKQQYGALGLGDAAALALEPQFRGRTLGHDDPRLTEALKGYLMQAVFYHLTGDPFCAQTTCRLYNAHWQEEVMAAQLKEGPEFCPQHEAMLEEWRRPEAAWGKEGP